MITETYLTTRSVSIGALVNDADGICAAQAGSQDTALTIAGALASGGSVTLATAQIVSIASVGDDSGVVFAVVGTDADGEAITESITGANAGTATGTVFFKTITSITPDAACAGNVSAGVLSANLGVGPTLRIKGNSFGDDFKDAIITKVTGTNTSTVEISPEDPYATYANGYSNDGAWIDLASHTAKTADTAALLAVPCLAIRLVYTAYTSGSVEAHLITRTTTN